MARFLAGILIGFGFGSASAVLAAEVIGTGYLIGWDVVYRGNIVCSDPFIWPTQEIECD